MKANEKQQRRRQKVQKVQKVSVTAMKSAKSVFIRLLRVSSFGDSFVTKMLEVKEDGKSRLGKPNKIVKGMVFLC